MKNRNPILILIIIILIGFIIYNHYLLPNNWSINKNKIWVFVEMKTTLLRDTSDYFYFGQISEEIINQIDNYQNTTGLFKLSNIRFWNSDDLLEVYEDSELDDFKIFRVSDIHHLRCYKKDPVLIYDMEELHESSKTVRSKY